MFKPSVSIVIPVFNEESSLLSVIKEVNDVMRLSRYVYKVIVVNDGSTDGSSVTLDQLNNEGIIILVLNLHREGYGKSLKAGFSLADTDLIVFIDADKTYLPAEIIGLIESLDKQENALACFGSRFSNKTKSKIGLIRYLGNVFLARLAKLLFGRYITDACSGLRVFKRELLGLIDYQSLSDDLDFSPQFTARCLKRKINFIEVPISYNKRQGKSKINLLKHGYKFTISILKERFIK